MDWLEQELRQALNRKEAAPDFAERVRWSLHMQKHRPGHGLQWWLATAAAFVIVAGAGGAGLATVVVAVWAKAAAGAAASIIRPAVWARRFLSMVLMIMFNSLLRGDRPGDGPCGDGYPDGCRALVL